MRILCTFAIWDLFLNFLVVLIIYDFCLIFVLIIWIRLRYFYAFKSSSSRRISNSWYLIAGNNRFFNILKIWIQLWKFSILLRSSYLNVIHMILLLVFFWIVFNLFVSLFTINEIRWPILVFIYNCFSLYFLLELRFFFIQTYYFTLFFWDLIYFLCINVIFIHLINIKIYIIFSFYY